MMQRPILKDGIVVNVAEIEEETLIVTKDKHKEMTAAEDAEYAKQLSAWQEGVASRQVELDAAIERLSLGRATLSAMKVKADGLKDKAAETALSQILTLEKEIKGLEADVATVHDRPLPPKPKMVRAKRWFYPEGCDVGPAGGNIGDRWNGKAYVPPEKPKIDETAGAAVVQ